MPINELNKILFVEDEIDIQTIVKFALEKRDKFTVKYCSSGKEALECAEEFAPDLILLDVMMPDMDGIATFQSIKKILSLKDTPVIFMTAKAQANDIMDYKKIGAFDVISKPFNINNLAITLREIWNRYNEQKKSDS